MKQVKFELQIMLMTQMEYILLPEGWTVNGLTRVNLICFDLLCIFAYVFRFRRKKKKKGKKIKKNIFKLMICQ